MRMIVLFVAAIAVFLSGSTSSFGAGATLPNSSIQSTISGPPNIVLQSATIALAPQCQLGKTVLTVTATYTNTGGSLASNTLSLIAADVTNPNFGRMDFIPALGAGQSGTMTLNVAYLQPNPQKMVGQHNFGVGLYNKPPMVNVKVTVPAAFCGFNPSSVGLSPAVSHATSSTAIANTVMNPPNLPTPVSLKYATDYNTCSQHLDQGTCESDIEGKAAFLWWDLVPCTGSNCVNNISGYNIYEVPRGWQPPRPLGVTNATAVNPGLASTNPVTSTGSIAAAPAPNAPSSGTTANTAHVSAPSNPQLMSAHVMIQNPTLVLQTGPNPRFAQMLPPNTVGRCFSVAARWASVESLYSEPICIASNAHVGYVRITLDPTALGTMYGGIHCAGTPPFAHPSGSIIAGDSDTNSGWCPYYQGVLAFDLTGSGFNPQIIAHASLTYDSLGYFNADGSTDSDPYQSYACSTIHDTIFGVEKLGDPHNGLVETDAMIDQLGGHPINVTDTVNRNLYSHTGMARFVIGRAGGMSEPIGKHCYSEWGNFHLVIDAYGTQ